MSLALQEKEYCALVPTLLMQYLGMENWYSPKKAPERHHNTTKHTCGSSTLLAGFTPRSSPSGSVALARKPLQMRAHCVIHNTLHGCMVLAAHHLATAGKSTYQSNNQGRIWLLIIPYATRWNQHITLQHLNAQMRKLETCKWKGFGKTFLFWWRLRNWVWLHRTLAEGKIWSFCSLFLPFLIIFFPP